MKKNLSLKLIIALLIIILIGINISCILIINHKILLTSDTDSRVFPTAERGRSAVITDSFEGSYEVYQNNKLINCLDSFYTAVEYARNYENAYVKKNTSSTILWDNTPIFGVYTSENESLSDFSSFESALGYARNIENSMIFSRKTNSFIWENNISLPESRIIPDVPLICQYPELQRGCEVTSLAMLINYKGISVDKLTLAGEIPKCSGEKRIENGVIYYANPNTGFVGDIYKKENSGFGVYHKPVAELLSRYVGSRAIDITGCNPEDIYYYINSSCPVWIITNTKYKALPESEFETWQTSEGTVRITYSEHSVLVTGYDKDYVYFNDPMDTKSVKKMPKTDFMNAWIQMGRQAITIVK